WLPVPARRGHRFALRRGWFWTEWRRFWLAGLLLFFLVLAIEASSRSLGLILLLATAEALAIGGGVLAVAASGVYATSDDEAMLEDPDDPETRLVEVSIVQNDVITGRDRGVLWLEGNCLLFMGHRSSFCIGTKDLTKQHFSFGSIFQTATPSDAT